ncbi:MAG: hypothetical protein COB07_02705 [Sulfurovum sp.]|nr:MAG: hypothetical protein COB07_07475 [Sulfurovum sp.]PHS41400.1 MAG: hypothetical protein COB07_02705 [Sulfurovum sp.]
MNTETLLNELSQLKDELTLKANLGAAEARDELKKLEPAYDDLKTKLKKMGDIAGDSASELKAAAELGIDADSKEDVDTALTLAAGELKDAYGKIKKLF